MKPEQITAIAREFAEEMCAHMEDDFIKDEAIRDNELTFKMAVNLLSQRYYLVEKSKLQSIIGALTEMKHYYNRQAKSCRNNQMREASEKCAAVMQGKAELLESLFPEIAKEVEE